MGSRQLTKDEAVLFLLEIANYFNNRPTHGEDRAFWSNVYNSENCLKVVNLLRETPNISIQRHRDEQPIQT